MNFKAPHCALVVAAVLLTGCSSFVKPETDRLLIPGMPPAMTTNVVANVASRSRWIVCSTGPNALRLTQTLNGKTFVLDVLATDSGFDVNPNMELSTWTENGKIHKLVKKLTKNLEVRVYRGLPVSSNRRPLAGLKNCSTGLPVDSASDESLSVSSSISWSGQAIAKNKNYKFRVRVSADGGDAADELADSLKDRLTSEFEDRELLATGKANFRLSVTLKKVSDAADSDGRQKATAQVRVFNQDGKKVGEIDIEASAGADSAKKGLKRLAKGIADTLADNVEKSFLGRSTDD